MNESNARGPPPGLPCIPPPGWTGPPPPGDYAHATELLWKICPPIIIIFGTFGNTLTVLILLRQSKKLSSTAVYLLTLAISDTMFLLNAPLRLWIIAIWEIDVRHISEMGCKFSIYLTYSSYQFSSWILVAVTVERFISIVHPHHVKIGCTTRISLMVIALLFIIIFGLNTHIFYGFGRSELPMFLGNGVCEVKYDGYSHFWNKIYAWIDLAVVFAIPFVILLVANSIIIHKLRQTRIERRQLSVMTTQTDKKQARGTKLVTVMLILLSVVFFLCLTPVSVFLVYRPYWTESIKPMICSDPVGFTKTRETIYFVEAVTNIIGYINAAFNFVLYVISGSKFRTELKSLFRCQPGHGVGIFGGATSTRRQSTITTQTSGRYGSQKSVSSVSIDPGAHSVDNEVKESGTVNRRRVSYKQMSMNEHITENKEEKTKDDRILYKTRL